MYTIYVVVVYQYILSFQLPVFICTPNIHVLECIYPLHLSAQDTKMKDLYCNIHSPNTLLGTPVHLLIRAIIQLANQVATMYKIMMTVGADRWAGLNISQSVNHLEYSHTTVL